VSINQRRVPVFLDTCAQVSLISQEYMDGLLPDQPIITKSFKCLGNTVEAQCHNAEVSLMLPSTDKVTVPITVVPEFSLSIKVPGLHQHLKQIQKPLSPSFSLCLPGQGEELVVGGILGADILPLFQPFEVVSDEGGNAFIRISDGFVPFGVVPGSTPADSEPWSVQLEVLDTVESKPSKKRKRTKKTRKSCTPSDCASSSQSSRRTKQKYTKPSPKILAYAIATVLKPEPRVDPVLDDEFSCDPKISALSHQYFSLDTYGEKEDQVPAEYSRTFQQNIHYDPSRCKYGVTIDWNSTLINQVPNNYGVCRALAQKVYTSTHKQGIDQEYLRIFHDQVEQQIIEPLKPDFTINHHKFIPHRPVIKKEAVSTKIRAVFNCSLRINKSPSINDSVIFPEDMLADLVDLFIYFRSNEFFALSDIQKAYLNIELTSVEDRNKFSFVVFNGNHFEHYRYRTVIFGFVQSPFFLHAVLHFHAAQCPNPHLSSIITNNLYVDNLIITHHSRPQLTEQCHQLSTYLESGGFHLRQWATNSPDVVSSFPEDDRMDSSQEVKLLGHQIDTAEDTICIKPVQLDPEATTKRAVLASVSSVFDPTGLIAPAMTGCKVFLRSIAQAKMSWDEPLAANQLAEWQRLCKSTAIAEGMLAIPRRAVDAQSDFELHVFSDASEALVGTTIYIVQNQQSHLIFAKSKLTPRPQRSLPTLELLALTIGIKTTQKIIANPHFPIDHLTHIKFYGDSQVALSWVLNKIGPKRNLFACNRVKEINQLLEHFVHKDIPFQLAYVPTTDNVADMLTRPISAKQFLRDALYYHQGPDWLITGQAPTQSLDSISTKFIASDKTLVYPIVQQPPALIDTSRFSSYDKLLNSLANVFLALDKFKRLAPQNFVHYRDKAFRYLLHSHQKLYFLSEIQALQSRDKSDIPILPKSLTLINKLNLYLDDRQLLRSKGRLALAPQFTWDAINPFLIEGKSDLARLLILNAHRKCLHLGTNSTLNYLRNQGLWLTKARVSVNSVIRDHCMICKIHSQKTFVKQPDSSLPASRVSYLVPFQAVGMDYTGAFSVTDTLGRVIKVYLLLFTCMTTRTVHLEVVPDMTTSEFLLAFIRFCSRFGTPQLVYSDNAPVFKQGGALLAKVLATSEVADHLNTHNIIFRNIPIYSPHQGGAWERLVGIVKQCLSKTFRNQTLTLFQFLTAVADCQSVINNRPLTYRDRQNELEIITPHTLSSNHSHIPQISVSPESFRETFQKATVRDTLTQIATTLDARDSLNAEFREEWFASYLLSLRERGSRGPSEPPANLWLTPGAVCLMKVPGEKRMNLPVVIIKKLHPDRHGVVRNVEVTRSGRGETFVNINNLVPLELSTEVALPHPPHQPPPDRAAAEAPPAPTASGATEQRPKRAAAKQQREGLQTLLRQGRL